jgi:hypothetical protein
MIVTFAFFCFYICHNQSNPNEICPETCHPAAFAQLAWDRHDQLLTIGQHNSAFFSLLNILVSASQSIVENTHASR